MATLKVTSWNIEHMDGLLHPAPDTKKRARLDAIAEEILQIGPDILCVLEGPKSEAQIDTFCNEHLNGAYRAIKATGGDYQIRGNQFIWFLVDELYASMCSLLPASVWNEFVGRDWSVHFWGEPANKRHSHFRHPQVLVLDWEGTRVEFIGLHLKSKFVQRGRSRWDAGGREREGFIADAIKARIKLTTEAANVRAYIDRKFLQTDNPAIFVMGDLNDGPGKEYFERDYLFFDLLSNIQGEVFFAQRFLNHALFDYAQHLRWSVDFDDFVDPDREPHILLDHIMFTQSLVDDSIPLKVKKHAGRVEHEIHELIRASNFRYAHPSDHRPVSVDVTI
jgi:endonuclease/exonuclease/phosphatase family metal-dependent hydrolase